VDDGVTVLLTTQYLAEADQLADTICLLDHGRIAAQGMPDELKASLGTEVIRLRFADDTSYQRVAAALRSTHTDSRLRTVEVATDGSAAEVLSLLRSLEAAGTPALQVSVLRPSLDDVFLSLTSMDLAPAEAEEMAR
jgi:ABC-2 type transport system ATP-binding protein